jgi:hypothetical protein
MPKLDVGAGDGDGDGDGDICKVDPDGMDAVPPCDEEAPPDSFDPVLQWSWNGDGAYVQSLAIPLVANLTDDDDNGEIDLCDTPDVVVVVFDTWSSSVPAHLYVLDGATGSLHFEVEHPLVPATTPALGDLDADGVPEIVALQQTPRRLVAFTHDGELSWESDQTWSAGEAPYFYGAIALADLDADGDVEIVAGEQIFDHEGTALQTLGDAAGQPVYGNATTAADLDDDGDLEVVLGRSAWHHDGAMYYLQPGVDSSFPQVADLDDDPDPEVLLENPDGLALLEHDGEIVYQDLRPTGAPPGLSNWFRPSTVHDFDGDDLAEYATSSSDLFTVYQPDAMVEWSAAINDGMAGGGGTAATAFDFLGDATAEGIYADENTLYVWDQAGQEVFTLAHTSSTIIEYPVVADVDNDGSAELVVVSSLGFGGMMTPTVQVFSDAEDRWVGARRIWNQHTYHVTNVREDGTIPAIEPRSWELLNTFRTQAQLEGGGVCQPEPEG